MKTHLTQINTKLKQQKVPKKGRMDFAFTDVERATWVREEKLIPWKVMLV